MYSNVFNISLRFIICGLFFHREFATMLTERLSELSLAALDEEIAINTDRDIQEPTSATSRPTQDPPSDLDRFEFSFVLLFLCPRME